MAKEPGRSEVRLVADDMPGSWAHWTGACRDVGLDPATTEPLSLWADGVPFTKTHSLFLVSISLRAKGEMRKLPVFAVETHRLCKCGTCAGRHSLDSMWQVLL